MLKNKQYVYCKRGFTWMVTSLIPHSPRASSTGRFGGGESLQLRLSQEFEFHLQFPWVSPSIELSHFHQSARNGNDRVCKSNEEHVPMVMTSLLMSSLPISIRHLHISHSAPYLPPPPTPQIWHNLVFLFSWVLQLSQEKLKTMLMQTFGGQIRCIMRDVQVANFASTFSMQICKSQRRNWPLQKIP